MALLTFTIKPWPGVAPLSCPTVLSAPLLRSPSVLVLLLPELRLLGFMESSTLVVREISLQRNVVGTRINFHAIQEIVEELSVGSIRHLNINLLPYRFVHGVHLLHQRSEREHAGPAPLARLFCAKLHSKHRVPCRLANTKINVAYVVRYMT